uniref:Uncharacterized protein n=1 Tax=Hyaloperonospora arabidopsidis (strain Emoy2) TaxID=559515 RepID=M4C4Z9_HYAAE
MTHEGRVSRVVARLLRPFHRDSHTAKHSHRSSLASCSRATALSTSSTSSSSSSIHSRGNATVRVVFPLKHDPDGIPDTVMMPPAFFRYLRAVVEQTVVLSSSHPARASHRGPDASSASSRARILRWRREYSTKTLEKLLVVLTEDDVDGFASSISRRAAKPVPLGNAVKALLQLWKCCLRILDVLAEDDSYARDPVSRHTIAHTRDASALAKDKRLQLKQTVLTLLALVIRRQELDVLFVAVGHGGCKHHKPLDDEEARRGTSRRSPRVDSHRQSWNVSTGSNHGKRTSLSSTLLRPCSSNNRRGQDQEMRLCDSVHRFLELHQLTLQYAFEGVHGGLDSIDNNKINPARYNPFDLQQDLLTALVATSYTRVPQLRSHILDNLSNQVPFSAGSSSRSVSRSFVDSRERGRSLYDDKRRRTPYNWPKSMYPQCQEFLKTVNREDRWAPSTQMLTQLLVDTDSCMLMLAQILEQLTGQQVMGRTDWKCVPGSEVLHGAALELAKCLFQKELLQCEPEWQDAGEDKAGKESASASEVDTTSLRDSFAMMDGAEHVNTPAAYFMEQLTVMMSENLELIHDYLMAILQSTNYMLPHHVVLCLQYMEKLMLEFPAFFAGDPALTLPPSSSHPVTEPQQKYACADVETLCYVFSCLLDSEHFEILKATELFLLKNFTGLSGPLQLQLTEVFASHFKRLFLHWNHDVRYCYHHMLLYLSYPGNRLVLGAKSDEALMGAKAAWLFEIPGLVRNENSANWDAFDDPLHELVTRYTQLTKRRSQVKQTPFTWVDAVSEDIIQRAMSEYKSHVSKYFDHAQQISMHQRVPIPVFSVNTDESESLLVDRDLPCTAAILA